MQRNISVNYWNRLLPVGLILAGALTIIVSLSADLLFGGLSGIGPRQVSLAFSGVAVLLAGGILVSAPSQRYIGEWILVVFATVVVAFASDLLVINGLPDIAAKILVLTSLGFSMLLIGSFPALSPGTESSNSWPNLFALDKLNISKFLSLALQLGLLVVVITLFQLENQAFYQNLMLITFFGFLIHYFLPIQYRLPFFLLLSLATIAGILGFVNGLWLVGIGLGLIGIAHLPVAYNVRVAVLLVAGVVLAALRTGWIEASWLDVLWPVLTSMFMFRLIIYVYDLKHGKAAPTIASTLSYFFLLPNVVFPFFPVVDYSTFRRTYYNEEQHQIYQRGLQWIFRGVIHLLLYRYVNYYVMIAPEDVTNTLELVRYCIANFALYLRISGQFHLIIGILHVFGFNLPETHHLYFMASSFTDLWRRINIYWKDFMLKVFYYPTYFKIRKWGPTSSLILATGFVFFLTWFFHAYQWFWLRGTFLLTAPDMVFWFILAVLVVANTLYEDKRGRNRALGQRSMSVKDIVLLALGTAGTFTVMATLWSLWSSDTIEDWFALISVVDFDLQNIALLLLVFVAITVIFGVTIWVGASSEKSTSPASRKPAFFKSAAATGGSMLLLFVIGNPLVYGQFGGQAQELIGDITTNRLSEREAAMLQRGYYEDLIGVNRFNSQLWEIYSKRPTNWVAIRDTAAVRATNDNLILELAPSTSIDFNGTTLTTNRWGMRDRDYEQIPAPNTYRIALTGPSFVMGLGVSDGQDFQSLLEDRLNRDHAGDPYAKYEILDFAVPGYSALQDLMIMEQRGFAFEPNALFFMAHQREEESVVLYLADRISVGAELPYADLNDLIQRAGVQPGDSKEEAARKLRPFGTEILSLTYGHIVETSRAQNVLPVWIFMPTLEDPLEDSEIVHLTAIAEQSGFIVLNLADAYKDQDPNSIVVAYWDKHPNAKGHQLIADYLYQLLTEKTAEIPIFE